MVKTLAQILADSSVESLGGGLWRVDCTPFAEITIDLEAPKGADPDAIRELARETLENHLTDAAPAAAS